MITMRSSAPHPEVHEAVLFPFDNHSIPFTYYLGLGLVPGRKHPLNPVVRVGESGKSDNLYINFYGTVLRIEDEFRMWYLGRDDRAQQRAHYAVSTDGIHWEKPSLNIVEYGGNKQNNLVDHPGCLQILILHDPEDPDPRRRFKSFHEGGCGGWGCVAYSPDGLRWELSGDNPAINHMFEPGGIIKFNGCYYVNGQGMTLPLGGRLLCSYASYDFDNWTIASNIGFRRDSAYSVPPPPRVPVYNDYYEGTSFGQHRGEQVHMGASLWNRGNVIIGFYGMWHDAEFNDRRFVRMDIGLVVSNDAIHFQEPIPSFAIISAAEEIDSAYPALMQGQAFENIGEETFAWYGEWGDHPKGRKGQVRLATWPRDRLGYFGMLRTGAYTQEKGVFSIDDMPHFISCPLRVKGSDGHVFINADGLSEHSRLTVELLEIDFRRIPWYAGEECIPISESGLRRTVRWKKRETVEALDRPFRIRVNYGGLRPEDIRVFAVYVGSGA